MSHDGCHRGLTGGPLTGRPVLEKLRFSTGVEANQNSWADRRTGLGELAEHARRIDFVALGSPQGLAAGV